MKHLIIVTLCVMLVAGCANTGPKEGMGGIIGAVGGGLLGSQIGGGSGKLIATAAGTLLGAVVGGSIGQQMDRQDRIKAQSAIQSASQGPLGYEVEWENPRSGNHGRVVSTREGTTTQGHYCREYHQTIHVGGKVKDGYGTACRMPDGSWKIINTD